MRLLHHVIARGIGQREIFDDDQDEYILCRCLMIISNIYSDIPKELPNELFEKIIQNGSFKLERIISKGHSTPKGKWYDQNEEEWVIVLKGSAGISIEGEAEIVVLKPGDYIHLPARLKHRVEWTDATTETVWLALYYQKRKGGHLESAG